MRNIVILFVSILLIQACRNITSDTNIIPFNTILPKEKFAYKEGWYTTDSVVVDEHTQYKGNNSIMLGAPIKKVMVFYFADLKDINEQEGDSITFSGKYKFEKNNDSKLYFSIEDAVAIDSVAADLSLKPDTWHHFSFTCPMDRDRDFLYFNAVFEGDNNVWISACELKIDNKPVKKMTGFDAEKDTTFNAGSQIKLGDFTPQMAENLYVLGKVWGFMKYYHPEVTKGKYNWDNELFRALPEIAAANNKEERNRLLGKWIDKYGMVTGKPDNVIKDSSIYAKFIDLAWLSDTSLFDKEMISKLENIRYAERSEAFNYYSVPYNKLFPTLFEREKSYKNLNWSDQGIRLLTLFRLWNIVEYCSPYRDCTDIPWDSVLINFIPRFVNAESEENYALNLKEIIANINDHHTSSLIIPNRKNRLAVELTHTVNEEIVVKATNNSEFKVGDIILSVNGKNIKEHVKELDTYMAVSRKGELRGIMPYILVTNDTIITVEILRKGVQQKIETDKFAEKKQPALTVYNPTYDLASKNIIYIGNANSAEKNRELVENNMEAKGIIIDMRKNMEHHLEYLPSLLLPIDFLPVSSSSFKNDKKFPGNYKFRKQPETPIIENTDYYKGKVAILVDENTVGNGMSWTRYLSKSYRCAIIGRYTSGTNGIVSYTCLLPLGSYFWFTAVGTYFPDWEQGQGLPIDIEANPTAQDIANGKDVWIEKAIEYIQNNEDIN